MPSSFTLPATMPEKARRRFAASVCAGWSRRRSSAAIASWVGWKGRWKSTGTRSDQLKKKASRESSRCSRTLRTPCTIVLRD